MRLFLAAIATSLVILFATSAAPSAGATDEELNALVDGPATGSGTVEASDECDVTNGFLSEVDLTYGDGESAERSGTVHLRECTSVLTSPFPVEGTFELVNGNGDTLTGTTSGTSGGRDVGPDRLAYDSVYTVTGGTGVFAGVTGTIAVTGSSDTHAPAVDDAQLTFAGDLHGAGEPTTTTTTPAITTPPSPAAVPVAAEPDFTG